MYIDLLYSFGSVENTKAAYERIMDLRIATPQNIMNYASFLQENLMFEESFRVYERAINMFGEGQGWPALYEIWINYLRDMIEKYADKKIERIRDLFS